MHVICFLSQVRFFQELQKSLVFQRRATSGQNNHINKKRAFWTLSRSVLALDSLAFSLSLLIIICFTGYWLVVDSHAVFLFETAHYINTFFIIVVSFYFMVRKVGLSAKVFNSMLNHFKSRANQFLTRLCTIQRHKKCNKKALKPFCDGRTDGPT